MSDDSRSPQLLRAVMLLRAKLLGGEFPPGERVAELTLAPLLGVSRTPLRLALGVLEHEGLLRTLPGGGFVVRDFTAADIEDAIERIKKSGKPIGILTFDDVLIKRYAELGCRFIAIGADIMLLARTVRELADKHKAH